ncbi:bifunctional phosphopantothenoylcysteine decarboxylase/phosphopantothenate--cysteine ligase CoaBC [Marinilongibacter aquaticus]|nr:bifunctional phosphopantothenoylcysteine decarboxylase/phosphopantothenate--cysteine ligase CoaBC [Marinilongibacter aquaticus]UBM61045.1 bifunctional phosphopantothenoylcysteine decarboxylase/phosphopantothenate--cysteine ligase CoaBC [Marinilongibacter aquaticus]
MALIKNKKILLGVTGSIAAYKSAYLVRMLVKAGAEVKVLMTPSAEGFITPLTLATLSKNPVLSTFTKQENGEWNNHVELGLWADLLLIAPLSANTLAKCAHGFCDNLLMATYLSARCPVAFAPAMDLDMYAHPSTQENLKKLKAFGHHIIEPGEGELASGLEGKGRMAEPEDILEEIEILLSNTQALKQKKVLITAGPTQEAIDPVRFISNHSSGKMGYELARVCRNAGAEVHLVSGPVNLRVPKGVHFYGVHAADEMYAKAQAIFSGADVTIFVAAVADYAPKSVSETKIKKKDDELSITLRKNPDIASALGKVKKDGQITVGFALETDNAEMHARKKIESKNLDMIVLNTLQDSGAGFRYDTNKVAIISKVGEKVNFPLKAKSEVAEDIVNAIVKLMDQKV